MGTRPYGSPAFYTIHDLPRVLYRLGGSLVSLPLAGRGQGWGSSREHLVRFSPHSRARDRLYPLTCWRVLADERRILCSRANGGWGRRVRTTRADPHPRPLPARGRGNRLTAPAA